MTIDLGKWMNDLLVGRVVREKRRNMLDEIIVAVLMVFVGIIFDFICRWIVVGGQKRYEKHHPQRWIELLLKHKVLKHFIRIIPGILVYIFLPMAFVHGHLLLKLSQKICAVYIILMAALTITSVLLMFLDVYESRSSNKRRPLKGLVQVCEVIVYFIGAIIVISIIIDNSPAGLLTGLGASAAILMLVFKDSILSFVAGIQLSANDMLEIGDWIQVPNTDANGNVEDITLNTVKVRNFDNTISTVPPYSLVTNCFKNWRGMSESGGRRVNKTVILDVTTLQFCTPEMLDKYRKDIPLLADYQPDNGVVPTNAQVYRVYIEKYLCSLPVVNTDLDLIISQLQMTTYGVPIMVYFFSKNKDWKPFEIIQSDIFDHLLAMVPKFDLKLYQYSD